MLKQKNFFIILSLFFFCTGHNVFAETAVPAAKVTEDPCAIEAKMPPHKRGANHPVIWACMRQEAANGNVYSQFYVGMSLVYGMSSEGKKAAEGIELLTKVAKNGSNGYSAMRIITQTYLTGVDGVPKNLDLAYQWAFLAEQKSPIKTPVKAPLSAKDSLIRGGAYHEEDKKKVEELTKSQPTIMEEIERQISPEHAEKLRKSAPSLLK